MLDIQTLVSQLKRPKLLVRAARFGLDDYKRERDLLRVLKCMRIPRPGDAIMQLLDVEAALNERRVARDATYMLSQHIDALTAIMGEARLLQASAARPQQAVSGIR